MKKQEYAIVDIETTGGNARGSRITEIAIIIHDGEKVIDQWETLVNPQREIPLPIFALTGIDNEMVGEAPIFDDIADKVMELLTNRIFVAHNVNFDYSFVRHELELAGFAWNARKLCTVRMARKIRPGIRSYSLGNLCRSLDIPIANRHRAGGDANATAILFTKLLGWDMQDEIGKMVKKTSTDQRLPPNLPPKDFEQLPERPGVYYFYNQARKVIYVGKAVNIKKRVASHFSGHNINPQRQHFLRDIYSISFEVCATELMALLLECAEIKRLWPAYNRALKRFEAKFGLYEYEANSGYKFLAVGKLNKHQTCIQSFNREYDGIKLLRGLAEQFGIDHRFCKYGKPAEGGAAASKVTDQLPEVEQHNNTVDRALDFLMSNRPSFAIMDRGRSSDERSCIYVENGNFYGMGYISTDNSFNDLMEVKDYITPYKSNHYMMQLVYGYANKNPGKVIVH